MIRTKDNKKIKKGQLWQSIHNPSNIIQIGKPYTQKDRNWHTIKVNGSRNCHKIAEFVLTRHYKLI